MLVIVFFFYEVAFSGGVVATSNSNYYLKTNYSYWLNTPDDNFTINSYVREWYVFYSGASSAWLDCELFGVRPVI